MTDARGTRAMVIGVEPWTWSHGVAQIAPSGWPTAISARANADLAVVASAVPLACSSTMYAEVRLDDSSDQVDVSLCISRDHRTAWFDAIVSGRLDATLAPAHRAWPHVEAVLRLWLDDPSADRAIHRLWLEFDRTPGAATSAPSVFIEFRRDSESWAALLHDLVDRLSGSGDEARVAQLHRLMAAVPRGCTLGLLGVMLGRGRETPWRLCLSGLKLQELDVTLRRCNGALPPIQRELSVLFEGEHPPALDFVDLDLDASASVPPRVGVECRLSRRAQAAGAVAEERFLDALVARGIVTTPWQAALTAWVGAHRLVLPHQLWPSIAVRRVNHVKLSWQYGSPVSAKGYCALCYSDAPSRRQATR